VRHLDVTTHGFKPVFSDTASDQGVQMTSVSEG